MNNTTAIALINRVSPNATRVLGRAGLQLKKNRPHILFGAGIAGVVATTVLACRSTLKLNDTLEGIERDIDQARGDNRDMAHAYGMAAGRLVRLYGPSLAVGVVSVGCLSGAHVDLTRRNSSLMAAYSALQAAYDSYRDRVRDDVGADRELDLYRGIVAVKDDEGKLVLEMESGAAFARVFDSRNEHYDRDPEINRLYIQVQQNYMNDRLLAKGHVFLNEVYDWLGFEHTPEGAMVGWLADGDGDGHIDFGLYTTHNISNEWGPGILLDFNVDGIILQKI